MGIYTTRAEATREQIKVALQEHLLTVRGTWAEDEDSWDGVQVVTNADLLEVLDMELPPPPERAGEVHTPARVVVVANCPNCHLPGTLVAWISAELTMDDDGSSLKLKAKSKAINHVCGQLALPAATDAVEGQESLPLDDEPGGDEPDSEGVLPSPDDDLLPV